MKKILFLLTPAILILLSVDSCKKEEVIDDPGNEIPAETVATNKWIYNNLDYWYLWNDKLTPGIDNTKESDPEKYFYKLLYKEKDKWSYITDDYATLRAEQMGEPLTMGYYPAFYLTNDDYVVIAVCYVYPDSPAEEAGLERGDIIISIDDEPLDTINYYTKYSGTSYSVQLGKVVDNTLEPTGESLEMTARVISADPSVYHEVLNIDGYKIGYLSYVEFISGDQDIFIQKLDEIFNEFKVQDVSDLILDIRYNPGGEINTAIHLASDIAPSEVSSNEELIINFVYNTDRDASLSQSSKDKNFIATSANIDMDRVYFLTSKRSASASELIIIGLEPYMDVIQIGDTTYGKYVGSTVFADYKDEWAMMPIITKFSNADGYTDFEDGLYPDHTIKDNLFEAVPFGDLTDPMIARAVELATGKSLPATRKTKMVSPVNYKQIIPVEMYRKNNLFIDDQSPGK